MHLISYLICFNQKKTFKPIFENKGVTAKFSSKYSLSVVKCKTSRRIDMVWGMVVYTEKR